MNIYDIGITIATIIFLFNVIPQIIRNFQFKNTLTQSITREILHQIGVIIIIIIFYKLNLTYSVIANICDLFIRFVLIIQIVKWRNHKIF